MSVITNSINGICINSIKRINSFTISSITISGIIIVPINSSNMLQQQQQQ